MDKSTSSAVAGFGTEPHQLKLGRSFDRDKHRAFHTVRYDFKPASVDHSKEAVLEVGEGNEVNITLPNIESKGTAHTKFKGSKRTLQKECVLIYDHRTGEFTLERLTSNAQVKKQREESKSRPLSGLVDSINLKNSPGLPLSNSRHRKMDLSSTVLTTLDVEPGGDISPLQPSPLAPSPLASSPHCPPSPQDDDDDDSSSSSSSSSSSYITDSDSDDGRPSNATRRSSNSSPSEDEDRTVPDHRNGGVTSRPFNPVGHTRSVQSRPASPPRGRSIGTNQNAQYLRSQLSQDLQLSDSDSD